MNTDIEQIVRDYKYKSEQIRYLMNTYSEDLRRIAYLYVHDIHKCEDIIQEVFLSAYHHLEKFREQSQYKTWLIRITINKCKDYNRKWHLQHMISTSSTEIDSLFTTYEKSPADLLEEKENIQFIIHTIHQLPSIYIEILTLHLFQQLSIKEISEVTNLKINTVKIRMMRGKALLKSALTKENPNI